MSKEKILLILFSAICLIFSIIRIGISQSGFLLFLVWNLILASIPWLITNRMMTVQNWKQNKWKFATYFTVWLLFFPNAPYILTDLFHLNHSSAVPLYFDLILLLLYSWTGIMFGFLSLLKMEKMFVYVNIKWTSLHSSLILILVSFGIYLGRYLRWNSWDAINNPFHIFNDVVEILLHPRQNIDAWGMTFAMTLLLNGIYWSIKLLQHEKETISKFPVDNKVMK